MFKGYHQKKFSTLKFGLGILMATMFCTQIAKAEGEATTPNINIQPSASAFSILTSEQQKKKVQSRFYISQDIARNIDRDPLFPGRSTPLYSFIGYEYFPNPELTYGLIATYTQEKEIYTRVNASDKARVTGVLPYVNYLIAPKWLLTAQAGAYVEDDVIVATGGGNGITTGSTSTRLRLQIFSPAAGAYVTWIGPNKMFTATVRAGYYYEGQRFRSAIDNNGFFYPQRTFDTSALTVSTRLKYFPEDSRWNAFLHVEGDFRVTASARPNIYKPDSGTQNRLFQIGPAIHYNLNDTWEVRGMYLYTKGFGYNSENRIGLRLRAAF